MQGFVKITTKLIVLVIINAKMCKEYNFSAKEQERDTGTILGTGKQTAYTELAIVLMI